MTMRASTTTTRTNPTRPTPAPDCAFCPRLQDFRHQHRRAEPDWFNAPVLSFGPARARLVVVGLAPGLRGANRTGRPFTGDHAGEILYRTLIEYGFARGGYRASPDDGLELIDCRITNAVRCVPPQNKPVGAEITACRRFLRDELLMPPRPTVVLTLGRIAHESVLRMLGARVNAHPFRHAGAHRLDGSTVVVATYHCSRYNINTGRLTAAMFEEALGVAVAHLERA